MASPRPYQRIGDIGTTPDDYDKTYDKYALEFDGVDDYLRSSLTGTADVSFTIGGSGQPDTGVLFSAGHGASSRTYVQAFDGTNSRFGAGDSTYLATPPLTSTQVVSYLNDTSQNVFEGYIGGIKEVDDISKTMSSGDFLIGATEDGAVGFYLEGTFYGVVVQSLAMSASNRGDLESYIAGKSGVTI